MTAGEFLDEWHNSAKHIRAVTSGSTGTPKSILLSKHDMVMSAEATNRFFNLGRDANFVCPMDFKYIGAKMMAVRALISGGILSAVTPSNNFDFQGTADLLAVVPSQIDTIVDNPSKASRIRNLIVGGAAVDNEKAARLIDCGINAYATYGMTETASHVALKKLGAQAFKALPGISFDVDERGCLTISLEGRDMNRVVTNDLVKLLSPTEFEYLGRYDNVINSGGIKIHPEILEGEIKKCLSQMNLPFRDVLVTSRKSDKWGEEAVCLVETDAGNEVFDFPRLALRLKEILEDPRYCPREFTVTDSLPRTESGKPIRKRSF